MSDFSVEIGPEGITREVITRLAANMATRQRRALARYKELDKARDIVGHRLLAYRCPRGCLLLDVFDTDDGTALYWPRHRRSDATNAGTDPKARATRTTDGDHQWIDRADTLAIMHTAWLNCDHVLDLSLPAAEIVARLEQVAGLPRRHADRKVIVVQ